MLDGHLKGIVTGIGNKTIDVKVVSHVSSGGTHTTVDYNNVYKFVVGTGVTNPVAFILQVNQSPMEQLKLLVPLIGLESKHWQ